MPPLADSTSHADTRQSGAYRPRALVADIGGTNMRFALSDLDELTISNYALFKNDLFASPFEALSAYLKTTPERPDHVGFAIAGSVEGDSVTPTNKRWTLTAEEVRRATGAKDVCFINDFEAIALSLPTLPREDRVQIGGAVSRNTAPMAVLGPGTGLGVAGLVRGPDRDIALAGEGGHVGFAARTAEDFEIVQALQADLDFVSAEQLISGPGLVALYQLLCERHGLTTPSVTPEDVVKAVDENGDVHARHALTLFARWLGSFAGDVALTFGARGGVFIGGGIAPRILSVLKDGPFRQAFEDKGRLSRYLEAIPIHVITTPNAGLKGAALAVSDRAARPSRG
ncbi:glucokinase [Pelagibacterium halotolerans]|uniref:glucokinase n=1 Tax=Pelagibacterium halotolerans TaxID=531813 RepID=UPI00384F1E33